MSQHPAHPLMVGGVFRATCACHWWQVVMPPSTAGPLKRDVRPRPTQGRPPWLRRVRP